MPMGDRAEEIYINEHMPKVINLIQPGNLIIAGHTEDEDIILGWVCFDKVAIHYVYVTDGWRHKGLATALLLAAGLSTDGKSIFSHYTYRIKRLMKKIKCTWEYDPYLL